MDSTYIIIVKDLGSFGDNNCCSICMEEFKLAEILKMLPCTHVFHRKCINKWKNNACPLCRKSILKFN